MTNRIGIGRVGRIINSNGGMKTLVPRQAIITNLPQPEGEIPSDQIIVNTRLVSPPLDKRKKSPKNHTLPEELKTFTLPKPKPKIKKKIEDKSRSPTPLRHPRTKFSIQPLKERLKKPKRNSFSFGKSLSQTPKLLKRSNSVAVTTTPTQTGGRTSKSSERVFRSRASSATTTTATSIVSTESTTSSVATQTTKRKKKKSPNIASHSPLPSPIPVIMPPVLLPNEVEDLFVDPEIDPDPSLNDDFPPEPPEVDQDWPIDDRQTREPNIDVQEFQTAPPSEIYEQGGPIPHGDMAPGVTDPIDVPRIFDEAELYDQPPAPPKLLDDETLPNTPDPPERSPSPPEIQQELESVNSESPVFDLESIQDIGDSERGIEEEDAGNNKDLPEFGPEPKPPSPESKEEPEESKVSIEPTTDVEKQPTEDRPKPPERGNSAPNMNNKKQEPPKNPRPRATSARTPIKPKPKPKPEPPRKRSFTDKFFGINNPGKKPVKTGSNSMNKVLKDFLSS